MYDMFFLSSRFANEAKEWNLIKSRFPLAKKAKSSEDAKKKSITKFFWIVDPRYIPLEDFKFDYLVPDWDQQYVHVWKTDRDDEYGGVYLIPKGYSLTKREAEYDFFVNKKEIDVVASKKKTFDVFYISAPEDYFLAQQDSMSDMFYAVSNDVVVDPSFNFSYDIPDWDQKYVHVFAQPNGFGGVYLIPKNYEITKKEAEYDFFVNKKEIDVVASKKKTFDVFYISAPEDYFKAKEASKTKMFYAILDDVVIDPNFDFSYNVLDWDKEYVHTWKNSQDEYSGVYLIPKNYEITKKEAEYNFFVNKKDIDIIASKPGFEIVFISYDESNAEENWNNLRYRFPYAKRIDKVDGIHNAHKEAAKITDTSMIWVVDGDAIILDDFNFDIAIPKWDRNITHVCKSKNPINDLEYGYGGVKLLPRKLLLEMRTDTVDMTTSISRDFKTLDIVSNITAFNTDTFNTWKSAFRECVKLSSKVIDGQVDAETQDRLEIWCTKGQNQDYGHWALLGAQAGRKYGRANAGNPELLSKINDWKWLKDEFKKY